MPQFFATVVPLAQTVQNDDLIPERSFRLHCRDIADRKVQIGQIARYIRRHCRGDVRVEGGFGAGLDFYGGANVITCGSRDCGIPKQQGLTVLVVDIRLQ
ncbi:hypothetical protein D3C85_1196330 [compost metagenome]